MAIYTHTQISEHQYTLAVANRGRKSKISSKSRFKKVYFAFHYILGITGKGYTRSCFILCMNRNTNVQQAYTVLVII